MKNPKIFIIAIAVMCAQSVFGQVEVRPLFGLNSTDVQESPDGTQTEAKIGWQMGVHLMIGNKLHLYPGITYFQQSTNYVVLNGDELDFDQRIAGVRIPLLLGYRIVDAKSDPFLNLRLFAGPTVSLQTKAEYSSGILNDEINWNQTAWSGRLGAGLDIAFLFFDFGYEFGLTDVHETENIANYFGDPRNEIFSVNAGLRLKL